jgi:hypothetical protein
VWGLLLARSQDIFYKPSHEIRVQSKEQALLYIALAGGSFAASVLQYYGQAQVPVQPRFTLFHATSFELFCTILQLINTVLLCCLQHLILVYCPTNTQSIFFLTCFLWTATGS